MTDAATGMAIYGMMALSAILLLLLVVKFGSRG
jgi:hypothetical protein